MTKFIQAFFTTGKIERQNETQNFATNIYRHFVRSFGHVLSLIVFVFVLNFTLLCNMGSLI